MSVIYNFMLFLNFIIYAYLIYVIFVTVTKKESFLWKDKLNEISNKLFKDLFDTKLSAYKEYKIVYLVIIISIVFSILLSLTWHMLVSSQLSHTQDVINNAAQNYNAAMKNLPH